MRILFATVAFLALTSLVANAQTTPTITGIELSRTGFVNAARLADGTTVSSVGFVHAQAAPGSVTLTECVCDRSGRVHGYAYFAPTEDTQKLFQRLRAEIEASGMLRVTPPTAEAGASTGATFMITVFDGEASSSFSAHVSPGAQVSLQASHIISEFSRLLAILQARMRMSTVA